MIIHERPPNFADILKAFPNADKPGVIFAFGPHIYNPSGGEIPAALLRHEGVHQSRQLHASKDRTPEQMVNNWWVNYIADDEFRYREELAAHVEEYRAQLHGLDRNYRAKLLQATAQRLIASLYSYNPPRSLSQALCDMRQELQR